MADDMDALFGTFMNEVNNLKSKKMKKIEEKAGGSADEIVERLTTRTMESAFQVLQLTPEATEAEITKQYRKMSVLIHPDKCKLPNAAEAFQILAKAYADTKDPNYKDKYKDVLKEAKANVRQRREKESKERVKRGEDPLDMEGNEFDREVLEECENLTTGSMEAAAHGNKVLEANMKRMQEQAREAKMRRREEEKEKKGWERSRDKRVAGWQVFMDNIKEKRIKVDTLTKVGQVGSSNLHHKREERLEGQGKAEVDLEDVKVRRSSLQFGATGVDLSYRKSWR